MGDNEKNEIVYTSSQNEFPLEVFMGPELIIPYSNYFWLSSVCLQMASLFIKNTFMETRFYTFVSDLDL